MRVGKLENWKVESSFAGKAGLIRCLPLLVLLMVCVPVAQAQTTTLGDTQVGGAAFYRFAEPGENTIRVMVMGDIGRTGLYEIGEGTDLAQLLALSGDRGFGIQRARQDRYVTIRLHRPEGGRRQLVYEASFEELVGDLDDYPSLQANDVIHIEAIERQRFGWRDALSIVTAVASLALAAERLSRL